MKNSILKRLPFVALIFASAAGLVTASGCDDDATPATANPATPEAGAGDTAKADTAVATSGTVEVVLTYTGTKSGPAICTLWPFDRFPGPGDMPVGLGTNETPTWPGTNKVVMKDIAPGHVAALCYMMIGAEHRMGPAGDDPVMIAMAPATPDVVAGGTSTSTAMLLDPPPPMGDAGDAGDAADGD